MKPCPVAREQGDIRHIPHLIIGIAEDRLPSRLGVSLASSVNHAGEGGKGAPVAQALGPPLPEMVSSKSGPRFDWQKPVKP